MVAFYLIVVLIVVFVVAFVVVFVAFECHFVVVVVFWLFRVDDVLTSPPRPCRRCFCRHFLQRVGAKSIASHYHHQVCHHLLLLVSVVFVVFVW